MASLGPRLALLAVAWVAACDREHDPERKSCDEAFEDWPCARGMCHACDEQGGEMLVLEASPAVLTCTDEHGASLVPEEDFCHSQYCDEVAVEPVDEAMAASFLQPIVGEHVAPLTWFPEGASGLESTEPSAGTETELTVLVQPRGAVETVRTERVTPETEGVPDLPGAVLTCGDSIGVDATLTLTTADGRLADAFDVRIAATLGLEGVPVDSPEDPWGALDLESLPPNVIVTPRAPAIVDDLRAAITFRPDGPSGGISVTLVATDGVLVMPRSLLVAKW